MNKVNLDRVFVVFVFFLAFMVFVSLMLFIPENDRIVKISTEGQPVLGNLDAPIEMVVFEDFQCPGCRAFHEAILPHIKSQYLDTGLVKLHIISLPLFEGSELAVKGCMAVYNNHPDSFEPFFYEVVEYLKKMPLSQESLYQLAQGFEEIDLQYFESEVNRITSVDFEKNLDLAKKIMKEVETPAIYIEGRKVDNISLSELFNRIESLKIGRTNG